MRKREREKREKRNIEKEESERERERERIERQSYVYEGLSRYVFLLNSLANVIFQTKQHKNVVLLRYNIIMVFH